MTNEVAAGERQHLHSTKKKQKKKKHDDLEKTNYVSHWRSFELLRYNMILFVERQKHGNTLNIILVNSSK